MKTQEFDYKLPTNKIAIHPPQIRGNSRLLVIHRETGNIEHKRYEDMIDHMNPGDLLILNNTKVINAKLKLLKEGGNPVEVIILEKHREVAPQLIMHNDKITKNSVLYTIDKKYKFTIKNFLGNGISEIESSIPIYEIARKYGQSPIPPYLNRDPIDSDVDRYQTTFAKIDGSVAAPTASLNFTENIKRKVEQKGIRIGYITLHVGRGTFEPIRTENLDSHTMHSEYYSIPSETIILIKNAKKSNYSIIALGTTVTRALEDYTQKTSFSGIRTYASEAQIFIHPGYKFRAIDKLITNFHAPLSTVLMLTAAFAGKQKLYKAYQTALAKNYKFLSYGDSMMIV